MTSCSPSRALCLVLTLSSVFNANAFVSPQSRRRAVVSSHLTSSSQLFAKDEPSASRYDLAVLGGGIVGVQAALVAKQQNKDRNVVLIDAPKESGVLYNEATKEDLSIGGPTGLFSKALRDRQTNQGVNVAGDGAARRLGLE